MIEFEKPNIECLEINEENNYAKFVCEPLERGYGITLGNSLRRILLSSLPGAAITSIKVDGVQHEFTTIPGIVEDVVEIILNLKNVRLKIHDNEEKNGDKCVFVFDFVNCFFHVMWNNVRKIAIYRNIWYYIQYIGLLWVIVYFYNGG